MAPHCVRPWSFSRTNARRFARSRRRGRRRVSTVPAYPRGRWIPRRALPSSSRTSSRIGVPPRADARGRRGTRRERRARARARFSIGDGGALALTRGRAPALHLPAAKSSIRAVAVAAETGFRCGSKPRDAVDEVEEAVATAVKRGARVVLVHGLSHGGRRRAQLARSCPCGAVGVPSAAGEEPAECRAAVWRESSSLFDAEGRGGVRRRRARAVHADVGSSHEPRHGTAVQPTSGTAGTGAAEYVARVESRAAPRSRRHADTASPGIGLKPRTERAWWRRATVTSRGNVATLGCRLIRRQRCDSCPQRRCGPAGSLPRNRAQDCENVDAAVIQADDATRAVAQSAGAASRVPPSASRTARAQRGRCRRASRGCVSSRACVKGTTVALADPNPSRSGRGGSYGRTRWRERLPYEKAILDGARSARAQTATVITTRTRRAP